MCQICISQTESADDICFCLRLYMRTYDTAHTQDT